MKKNGHKCHMICNCIHLVVLFYIPFMIQWRWCHDESSEYRITKPVERQFSVTSALDEFSDGWHSWTASINSSDGANQTVKHTNEHKEYCYWSFCFSTNVSQVNQMSLIPLMSLYEASKLGKSRIKTFWVSVYQTLTQHFYHDCFFHCLHPQH